MLATVPRPGLEAPATLSSVPMATRAGTRALTRPQFSRRRSTPLERLERRRGPAPTPHRKRVYFRTMTRPRRAKETTTCPKRGPLPLRLPAHPSIHGCRDGWLTLLLHCPRWGFTEDRDRWSKAERAQGNRLGTASASPREVHDTLDGSRLKEASYLSSSRAAAARHRTQAKAAPKRSTAAGGQNRSSNGQGSFACPEPACPSHSPARDRFQLGEKPGRESKIHGGPFGGAGGGVTSPNPEARTMRESPRGSRKGSSHPR